MVGVSWEEGIIGKMEQFLLRRFPIGPMWARAIPTALTSVALHNATLRDEMGLVKANVFITYIAPSGLGCKTPLVRFARNIMFKWAPSLLSVGKFTPEGYTEYVGGTKKKKDREPTLPHPVNIAIRDEFSKFLSEQAAYNKTILEFFSDLWDGWIEGSYTRKIQFEGKIPVYFTLLSSSTEYFLNLLKESFFTQGVGNRILWIVETPPEPKRKNEDTFFFGKGEKDVEADKLTKETIENLANLTSPKDVFILQEARKLWVDYDHKMRYSAYVSKNFKGSFEIKQSLNVLKLGMIYSGSCFNYHEGVITIDKENMKRAIEDTNKYYDMWNKTMDLWKLRTVKKRLETRLPSSKYDLLDMLNFAKGMGGLTSVKELSDGLNCPDRTTVGKVVALGVSKGLLKIVAEKGKRGNLSLDQYSRFKGKRGPSPQIFMVTEKGGKWKGKKH